MARARFTSSESGFALIEAVVSAAVLAIIAMAVLSGIDAASSSSAREKARAVAATLAEQDQEAMRAMDVDTLSKVNTDKNVTVDGAKYKVTSKAEWVTDDAGGTPACGNSSKNNEYLHITTTVTSALVGSRVEPVVIDSLVAPSTQYSSTHGILGIKVIDRNGAAVAGANVTATSTSPSVSRSGTTDSNGCVIMKQLLVATYTVTVSKANYVGTDLEPIVTVSQKATPGTVTFKTIEYDYATTARVTVRTTPPGTATTQQATKAAKISLTNAKATGLLKTYTNGAPANAVDINPLYPFKATAYGFFTGSCGFQSPDFWDTTNPNYFGSYPGSLVMDPTLAQPQAVTVLQPPLNLRITRNYSNNAFTTASVTVFAKLDNSGTGDTCTEGWVTLTFMNWPSPVGTWGSAPGGTTTNWVSQVGSSFDPGMPYGKYTLCVRDTAPSTDQYQKWTYDNTKANGAVATTTNASQSWSSTKCGP